MFRFQNFFSETYETIWTVGRTQTGDQPDPKASTYTGQHNTGKRGHTTMPRARFEPLIPVFEWSKTVRALYRVAIGTTSKENFAKRYFICRI